MTLMENHFRRYADYFTSDECKVAEGVAELSEPLVWEWGQYEKDISVENIKWKDFYTSILSTTQRPSYVKQTRNTRMRASSFTKLFEPSLAA
jgi:hypothetical protein